MSESPRFGVDLVEEGGDVGVDRLGLEALVVEAGRVGPVAGGDEGPVVVGVDAEALGQAPAPGPLLAGGLVARPGDDVLEVAERLEPAGVDEPDADEHVLVGEGEHGPAVLVGHQRLEHGVALRRCARPTPGRRARRACRRCARACRRRTLELAALAGLGDEHPRLGHLRQQAGLVAARALGAEVGHLGQLAVAQLRAILGLDLDRHAEPCLLDRSSPRSERSPDPHSPVDGRDPCNSTSGPRASYPQVSALTARSGNQASEKAVGPEQDAHLAEEPAGGVDADRGRRA